MGVSSVAALTLGGGISRAGVLVGWVFGHDIGWGEVSEIVVMGDADEKD